MSEEKATELRARDRAKAERLKGRTIVRAVPHSGWDDAKSKFRRWVHCWHLHLDDGSVVTFITEETETGFYGTDVHIGGA